MLVCIMGVSGEYSGTSAKGNPYSCVYTQMAWEDATKRGYACESIFTDLLIYEKYIKPFVEDGIKFPTLANANYDPRGRLVSIELLDTTVSDLVQFFGHNDNEK